MSRHSCLAAWPLAFWSCFSSCQCKAKCCTSVWMNRAEPGCKRQGFGGCGLLTEGRDRGQGHYFPKPVLYGIFQEKWDVESGEL